MRKQIVVRTNPELPDNLIHNCSLERKLDRLADSHAVIRVAAPPRSGKRTAVNSWLRRRKRATRWMHGHEVNTVEAFLAELPRITEADGTTAEETLTIVLEGVPLVSDDVRRIETAIAEYPGLQMILVEDRDERLSSGSPNAAELSSSDLALDAAAIAGAMTEHGLKTAPSTIAVLARHYAGNPALVAAALNNIDSLPANGSDVALATAHAHEFVALCTRLFGQAGLDFAALLALAGDVPKTTALDVLRGAEIEQSLRLLWERGLIAIDTSGLRGDILYRLPASVRELVRAATLAHYLARREQLHRHAAAAAVACGDLVGAVRLLALAGDARSGVGVFIGNWDSFHQRGDWNQLFEAFELLDRELVLANPEVCAILSIVRAVCGHGPAFEPFEARVRTVTPLEFAALSLRQQSTIRVAQTLIAVRRGRTGSARRLATQAFVSYEASEPRERLELRSVYLELVLAGAQAALTDGALRACVAFYDEALVLADYEGSAVGLYRATCGRAFALALSGEFAASLDGIHRAIELREQHETLATLSTVELAWSVALLRIHTGATGPEHPVLMARGEADSDVEAVGRYLEVRARLTTGQSAEAVGMLRLWLGSVQGPVRHVPLLRQMVVQTLGLALLLADRPGEALRVLEDERSNQSHMPCLARVRPLALIAQGSPREALAATEECVALGHDHSLLSLPYVYIARAVAFEALELPFSADDALQTAFATIAETGARIDLRSCLGENLIPVINRLRVTAPALVGRVEPQLDGLVQVDPARMTRPMRITPKERQVLLGIAGTQTIPEIAKALYLSENTVKTHLRSIYGKLGVGSRLAAVDVAARLGILVVDGTPDEEVTDRVKRLSDGHS